MLSRWRSEALRAETDQRATFVELFFDLVFVFAVTQVVAQVHHHPTTSGVVQGLLVFWLVWWAWTQFTWTLNPANTEHKAVEVATLLATALAFIMAFGLPAAFDDGTGLWFAIPYVAVRLIGLGLYLLVAWNTAGQRESVIRFFMYSVPGLLLALVGGALEDPARYWVWAAVIVADFAAAGIAGSSDAWQLNPRHFAERHGLFVIVALGESLIAVGIAASELERDLATLVAVALGVVLASLLWWTYFADVHPGLEHRLLRAEPAQQAAIARDAFSFLHYPLIGGIIGMAVGLEAAVAHPDQALHAPELRLLVGGALLVVVATALAYWRASGRLLWPRLAVAAAAAVVVAVSSGVDAVWILVELVVALVVVVAVERTDGTLSHTA